MRWIGFGPAAVAGGPLCGAGGPEPAGGDKRMLVEEELARFQGTWQPVSAEADGVKAPKDRGDKSRVVIKGPRRTVIFGDELVAHSVPFDIDPTTTPKSVVDTLEAGPEDSIMHAAVLAKFTQHADLRETLLATGDSKIVEHTENDAYWGDGGDGSGK